ncbi:MAG: ADP-ribosylation factor-like protein [Candidatus Hodarchaeota archaeon]
MLQRFSIAIKGGIEIFDYQPDGTPHRIKYEPQLMSGFLEAIQLFSEEMKAPIHQIHFFNLMLYVKTYGEFSLRLILSTKLPENEIEDYFGLLANETLKVLESYKIGTTIDDEDFLERMKLILTPLTEERFIAGSLKPSISSKPITKVGLVGLAKAGKSSIKRRFFDNWSPERVKNILPTVNVDITRNFQNFFNDSITIMDFGGQKAYRILYLRRDKESLWRSLSALIFVVDIQAEEKFEAARKYLDDVWKIVCKVNNKAPRLSIFFHKFDQAIHSRLKSNIQSCYSLFRDYSSKATFYLTTVEDDSCNLALVKSLYFSLPLMMLKHQLEVLMLDTFENTILPELSPNIDKDLNKTELEELEQQLYEKGKIIGINSSYKLQENWLKALTGDWVPQKRPVTSRNIKLELKGQSYFVTIQDWSDEGISKKITDAIIGGLLEGLLLSFHFGKPKVIQNETLALSFQEGKPIIVRKEGDKTTWELFIDEKFRI